MKLLIVEDEVLIRQVLVLNLAKDGHETRVASTAESALECIAQEDFDGFVFDVMLPGMSGRDLCRLLRSQGFKVPILLLTAQAGLDDKVAGLDAGANDYLTKPFDMGELRARLRAMERMARGYPRPVITSGDLVVDPNERLVHRAGASVELTPKEFALLELLLANQGEVVPPLAIAQKVWGSEDPLSSNVINVFVNSLRKKLDPQKPFDYIRTVRGRGFSFSAAPTS